MATYTITINERTNSGKSLLIYLRSLGLIKEVDTEDGNRELEEIVKKGREEKAQGKGKRVTAKDFWK